MIFVDSGYLIALLDASDQLHRRAVAWSTQVAGPYILSMGVVIEVMNYFSAAAVRSRVVVFFEQLEALVDWDVIQLDSSIVEQGFKLFKSRRDKDWSLTDCISFILMTNRGITRALAYDHHFEQAGFEALLRRDPP